MTDRSETGGQDPLFMRAVERYGGREAVGSALWLEHTESITYFDEAGNPQTITPSDLVADEKKEAEQNFPMVHLWRTPTQDAALVARETWLRRTILPTLPLRVTGDKTKPPLKFDADLKVFTVPRELAQYTGIVAEENAAITEDKSLAFSLRLTPTQGRVESAAIYPGYTGEDYSVTAVEFGVNAIRLGIGYQKYVELYREPQTGDLPPLIAPHQF